MVIKKSALDVDLLNGGRKMFDEKDIISKYTMDDALDDGVFVMVGITQNKIRIVFTSNLFSDGYEDFVKRDTLIKKGLELLAKPDKEDTHWKLRVIEKNKIWVVYNSEGITFMKPEDY